MCCILSLYLRTMITLRYHVYIFEQIQRFPGKHHQPNKLPIADGSKHLLNGLWDKPREVSGFHCMLVNIPKISWKVTYIFCHWEFKSTGVQRFSIGCTKRVKMCSNIPRPLRNKTDLPQGVLLERFVQSGLLYEHWIQIKRCSPHLQQCSIWLKILVLFDKKFSFYLCKLVDERLILCIRHAGSGEWTSSTIL